MEAIYVTQLPKEHLRRMVSEVLAEQGFDINNTKYEVKRIKAGLWMSTVFRVMATDGTKTLSLFLKCININTVCSEVLFSPLHFKNEITFCNRVYPVFENLLKRKHPEAVRAPIPVPKYYRATGDGTNDVIIMEDLSENGFFMLNCLEAMGFSELELVMREIGRFHAFSLVLKSQNPDLFNELRSSVFDPVFQNSIGEEILFHIYHNVLQDVLAAMKVCYQGDSPYFIKFEKFVEHVRYRLNKHHLDALNNEPFNVFTHGDLWSNNLMFRYSSDSPDKPRELRFLDFQQTRYTSPAADVGRMLFVATDRQTRTEHREELLHSYYDSLSATVSELGSDPEQLFPFKALEQQLKAFGNFILDVSLLNIPHALNEDSGSANDVTGDDMEGVLMAIRLPQQRMTEKCRRRVFDVIEECVDRGYI
ncbi:uncharacterized protein [Periplaneta americana]|uniref:uncharacterized protein n=1 Tax=Periplaneta americana TaxID=6978 RepID=UPI0037E94CFD